MRNDLRLVVLVFVASVSVSCGGGSESPPSQSEPADAGASAATPGAAASSKSGASSTPGVDMRASATASAPKPTMMLMDVPSGTELLVTLESAVSSETAMPEQRVRAKVAKPVVISGMTVIPEGAPVVGTIVSAERSGRVKGRASIAMRFSEVTVAHTPYKINTARIVRQAEATKGKDAKKIAIGAGAGAVIGAIAGGKKGAAVGTAVGGGAGTGAVLATRGEEVTIGAGTTLRTTIQETVRINAPM
jgi:hypothetical protein